MTHDSFFYIKVSAKSYFDKVVTVFFINKVVENFYRTLLCFLKLKS